MTWDCDDESVPYYVRVYFRNGNFIRLDDLESHRGPKSTEIYVLPNTPLRSLPHLLAAARSDIFPFPALGTRLLLQALSPPMSASGSRRLVARDLGNIVLGGKGPGALGTEEDDDSEEDMEDRARRLRPRLPKDEALVCEAKTFAEVGFQPGDCLSIAILIPGDDGLVPDAGCLRRDRERDRDRDAGREWERDRGVPVDRAGVRDRGWGVQTSDGFRGGRDRRGGGGGNGFDIPRGDWRRGDDAGRGRGGRRRW